MKTGKAKGGTPAQGVGDAAGDNPAVRPIDPYLTMQINPRADQAVFEAAYAALKKSLTARGDRDQLAKLEEAWRTVGDPVKRAEFDALNRRRLEDKTVGGGRYRIKRFIAEGATGETYEAEYLINGETVCLKHFSKIDPKLDDLLIQEFNAMRRVRHYAFPAAYDLIRLDDGCLALVMTYIPGPTLAQLVEKHGRLDPETVSWITERLLNSLMYLHLEHGIVHGDIKPQNIIIVPDKHHAVLIDFGLAVIKPTFGSGNKGFTEHFAAPEMMNEDNPPLPESDFYGLGMVMYFALGGGIRAVKAKTLPAGVPRPFREFLGRLVLLEPLERPRWENENLYETIQRVRQESFGRANSNMKEIVGL